MILITWSVNLIFQIHSLYWIQLYLDWPLTFVYLQLPVEEDIDLSDVELDDLDAEKKDEL